MRKLLMKSSHGKRLLENIATYGKHGGF